MIESCTVQPSETQGWEIKFPDEQTKEALVFVFNQIGGEEAAQIESTEFVKRDRQVETEPYRLLSLVDPKIKFAVCTSTLRASERKLLTQP